MRAVVTTAPGEVFLRQVPEPVSGPKALVAVRGAGICGTDIKVLQGNVPIDYPRIMGHELIGEVLNAGERGVIREGQRVLIDPVASCGVCAECLADRSQLCVRGSLMGRDVDGGFADLVAVDERQLHTLPDSIDDHEAVLLQVLGTCVHGQDAVEVFPGQSAVVVGMGVTGLLHVQLLRARGLDRILGVSRSQSKRDLAERIGASAVAAPENALDAIRDLTSGRGADVVVESVGTTSTLARAIELAAPGGSILMFGTIVETAGVLPFYDLYFKELVLRGTRAARPRDYARAIALADTRRVALRPLLWRNYPLEEAASALGDVSAEGALKITLEISRG